MSEKTRQEHKEAHREREHFFSSAKVVAGITLVSRVFGLFRDMGVTSLGANRLTDAYGLAFQIPNLFRRLFGEGALSSAFVPVFTDTVEKDGFEKASKLLANAMALLAVFLLAVMLLVEIVFVVVALLPGSADRQFLMMMATIMFPYMVTVCLLALGSAALNCRGHFAFPAAAPIIFNIVGIVAAWWIAPMLKGNLQGQLVIVAFSVIIAGLIQLIAILWLLRRSGFSIRVRLTPVEPGIVPIIKLLMPVLLGLGFFADFGTSGDDNFLEPYRYSCGSGYKHNRLGAPQAAYPGGHNASERRSCAIPVPDGGIGDFAWGGGFSAADPLRRPQ